MALQEGFVNLLCSEWKTDVCDVFSSSPSVVIGLHVLNGQLIVAKMNGDVIVVDFDENEKPQPRILAKVSLPIHLGDKALEYSELDAKHGTLFFTLASSDGIFQAPQFLTSGGSFSTGRKAVLGVFVLGRGEDHEFWGMAVDADRRLLYCCDRRSKSSIGAWRLADGCHIFDISGAFSFLQCCTIAHEMKFPPTIAVSSSPSQRILLFQMCDKQWRFKGTVAGKKPKRRSDPVKFVVNPLGMAFDSSCNLVVADCGSSKIQVFSANTEEECSQKFDGRWQSEKMKSSPRCVSIAILNDRPVILAGLHNGDVSVFKPKPQKIDYKSDKTV